MPPGIPQNIGKPKFSLDNNKSNLFSFCGSNLVLCVTYYTIYALKPVDKRLKHGQFSGFPDTLTPTTPNLYTVFDSKLKLNLTIWREFYQGFVSDANANKLQKQEFGNNLITVFMMCFQKFVLISLKLPF